MTTNVTDINEGKKVRAAKKAKQQKEEVAPLEAYPAESLPLNETDFVITGCDGDQAYVWIASKPRKRKRFKVVEVYPGLDKPKTALRGSGEDGPCTEAIDMVLEGTWTTIDELKEDLTDMLFEGFEDLCEIEGDEE